MSNIKKVFSLGLAVLVLTMVIGISAPKAEAATCTASAGDWMTVGTWSCARVPLAGDDVVIPTAVVVTLGTAGAVANTISFDAAAATSGITMASPATLTVTGVITIPATTADAVVTTFAVADGTLTAGGVITITGSATDNRDSVLSATSGTINANGGIAFAGTAAEAQVTIGSGGTFNLGGTTGTIGTGGTLSLNAASITSFTGTGAQTVNGYTYGILTINKSGATTAGTATLADTVAVAGALNVTDGILDTATATFAVTGATTVSSGASIAINSLTGSKAFNGAVTIAGAITETVAAEAITFGSDLTISSGGTLTEFGAAAVGIAGSLENNGTYTASTGAHTLSGTTKTISGSTATTIAVVTIAGGGNYTNSATLTVTTLTVTGVTLTNTGTINVTTLTGAGGTFTNTTGTLNVADAIDTLTLNATNNANTINYTKAGNQTVFDGVTHEYGNLGLSGSGAKSITAATLIGGTLTITDSGTDTTATLVGTANTADRLILTGSLQRAGTWGSTGPNPDPAHANDTHFTAVATGTIAVANGSSGSSSNNLTQTVYTNTATPPDTTTPSTPATPATPASGEIPGCGIRTTGFSSSSGTSCVGNSVPSLTNIPGCGNRTTGFSSSSGTSCVGNSAGASASAPGRIYSLGSSTLKNGSRGEAAKELQRFLNDKLALGLVVDGIIGPKSIAVIKTWQRANGLVADGLIGPLTKAKINAQ